MEPTAGFNWRPGGRSDASLILVLAVLTSSWLARQPSGGGNVLRRDLLRREFLGLAAALAAALLLSATPAIAGDVVVFAAASLKDALDDIATPTRHKPESP